MFIAKKNKQSISGGPQYSYALVVDWPPKVPLRRYYRLSKVSS